MPQKRVLIVEDRLEFRAILGAYLERHGYRVLTADEGATGVRMAIERQPDLILMDGGLPGMDGVEGIRRLKQDPATRSIRVVLLTAMSYGAVGRRAREAGCDAVLTKPIEPSRVLEEVRRWLDAGPACSPAAPPPTRPSRSDESTGPAERTVQEPIGTSDAHITSTPP